MVIREYLPTIAVPLSIRSCVQSDTADSVYLETRTFVFDHVLRDTIRDVYYYREQA